ncbi:MAG: hypothetical protein KDA58_10130 [Planctomycetaceae bacterium]|nr:hypothetical protein [Planctomycetaceae bacterium]MCA9080906.1 hypothetical protein [Planctomycetaceae bacterium]
MAGLDQRRIGDLDCLTITSEQPPELLVVISHGFGAPGDDLVSIGAHLLQMHPQLLDRVEFVFPAAPLDLSDRGIPGGRAWWMIDMEELQRTIESGQSRNLRSTVPDGLTEARDSLGRTVGLLRERHDLEWDRVVLGGFSQGAILSTDLCFRLPANPAALIAWSGTLINEAEWRQLASRRAGMPMLQSHGRSDAILPFSVAEVLRDLAQEHGIVHQWRPFSGQHEIPAEIVQASGDLLVGLLPE